MSKEQKVYYYPDNIEVREGNAFTWRVYDNGRCKRILCRSAFDRPLDAYNYYIGQITSKEDSYDVQPEVRMDGSGATFEERLPGISAKDFQVGGEHYKSMDIQPTAFIVRNSLSWCEGNAIKYICRHNTKGGVKDIDKAIHYLELLKEMEYGDEVQVRAEDS